MLNTEKLENAKIGTSQNGWLMPIFSLCTVYNNQVGLDSAERINILERLITYISEWITSHPPKVTNTNQKRWKALEDLAEQIYAESTKLGVRFLISPTDLKGISNAKRSYWLEMVDPFHRPGWILSDRFDQWKGAGLAGQSFWDYIGVPGWGTAKVKYYGDPLYASARANKRKVRFLGSVLQSMHPLRLGNPFSTRGLTTLFSGAGWGIFVVDREGSLYIHKHVQGVYHHSTFLSGAAVQAAGEIVVDDNGKVRIITAKSGHYAPTKAEMARFLVLFPGIPHSAIIRPDFADMAPTNPQRFPRFYPVKEWRLGGGTRAITPLNRAKVTAAFPFGIPGETQTMLNHIPLVTTGIL